MMKNGMKPKKKMYGGAMKKKKKKKMNVGGKMKPDYIDLDKDGNKTESMKKASMDMKKTGTKAMYGGTMKKKKKMMGGTMKKKKTMYGGGMMTRPKKKMMYGGKKKK